MKLFSLYTRADNLLREGLHTKKHGILMEKRRILSNDN